MIRYDEKRGQQDSFLTLFGVRIVLLKGIQKILHLPDLLFFGYRINVCFLRLNRHRYRLCDAEGSALSDCLG